MTLLQRPTAHGTCIVGAFAVDENVTFSAPKLFRHTWTFIVFLQVYCSGRILQVGLRSWRLAVVLQCQKWCVRTDLIREFSGLWLHARDSAEIFLPLSIDHAESRSLVKKNCKVGHSISLQSKLFACYLPLRGWMDGTAELMIFLFHTVMFFVVVTADQRAVSGRVRSTACSDASLAGLQQQFSDHRANSRLRFVTGTTCMVVHLPCELA